MNVFAIEAHTQEPLLVQVMPNSSFPVVDGGSANKSKGITGSATTCGQVWYGTYRAGVAVEEHFKDSYFLESPVVGDWPNQFETTETNAFSDYRRTIAEIENQIHNGEFAKARKLFGTLPENRLANRNVSKLASILSRPNGRVLESGTGRLPNSKWLASNRGAFAGKWVALESNSLVDSGTSLKNLRLKVQGKRGSLRGIQFVRMDD